MALKENSAVPYLIIVLKTAKATALKTNQFLTDEKIKTHEKNSHIRMPTGRNRTRKIFSVGQVKSSQIPSLKMDIRLPRRNKTISTHGFKSKKAR